jgi:hypothetical protein
LAVEVESTEDSVGLPGTVVVVATVVVVVAPRVASASEAGEEERPAAAAEPTRTKRKNAQMARLARARPVRAGAFLADFFMFSPVVGCKVLI